MWWANKNLQPFRKIYICTKSSENTAEYSFGKVTIFAVCSNNSLRFLLFVNSNMLSSILDLSFLESSDQGGFSIVLGKVCKAVSQPSKTKKNRHWYFWRIQISKNNSNVQDTIFFKRLREQGTLLLADKRWNWKKWLFLPKSSKRVKRKCFERKLNEASVHSLDLCH